jgi:uncharacterized protein YbjQ (UPF0145 family)
MAIVRNILVTTTSSLDGPKIKQYLRPVSAHVVAGTGLFSDFAAGLSDVFGGRSKTYQKQLVSLYTEAVEKIKLAAYEIGANCIIGLSIDMDEISGKGKSMFMLTAVGTAVIIENVANKPIEEFENASIERINLLRDKKNLLQKAETNKLVFNDETWSFITENQIHEAFPYMLKKLSRETEEEQAYSESIPQSYQQFVDYVDSLPDSIKTDLLYENVFNNENKKLEVILCKVIKELNLFDFKKCMSLLQDNNFLKQKIGVRISTYGKLFYNEQDVKELEDICGYINEKFPIRGKKSTKKTLMSSEEKEIWICECGKTNDGDMELFCKGCKKDIYGFTENEINPQVAVSEIQEKIGFVKEILLI